MFAKLISLSRYLLALPKTVYTNFRLLKFGDALKLPIIVSHKTHLKSLSGKVTLQKAKTAQIKIGFGETPTTDFRSHRPVLNITGEFVANGKCRFGIGSKLHIHGLAQFGDNFNMTGNSTIVCNKGIQFDKHVLISWDVQIMDTDQHFIYDHSGKVINEDQIIHLKSDVWVCSGARIIKGTHISEQTVIGANSLVSGKHTESNVILAGNPAKIVKRDITWN